MNKQNTLTLVESLLIDYASGSLPLALEVLVESHISMNPSSARSIRMLLQIGGALMENSEPISMSEGSFEKLMDEIDAGQEEDIVKNAVSNDNDKLPLPLRNYISETNFPKNWRRIGIGLSEQTVDFGDEFGSAKLYRIAPGCGVPSHSHDGNESPSCLLVDLPTNTDLMAQGIYLFKRPGLFISPLLMPMENA